MMYEDIQVVLLCLFIQESLQSEVIPDPMEGEQTWPTDDELKEAEGALLKFLFICVFSV